MATTKQASHTTKTNLVVPFDSNPFTTALTALKKLFTDNANTLVGFVILGVVIALVIGASVVAIGLTVLSFLQQHNLLDWSNAFDMSPFSGLIGPLNDASIFATWAIGAVLVIGLGAMLQLVAMSLGLASSEEKMVGLGAVIRYSFKRLLPAIGLALLLIVSIAAPLAVLGFATQVLGPIGFVLMLVVGVLLIYVMLRWSYVWLVLVDGRGPIQALKESWQLSAGHLTETLGILATGIVILLIPVMAIDSLAMVSGGIVTVIFSLISVVLSMLGTVAITAILAERFQQLRSLKAGKTEAQKVHPYNYLAIVLLVISLWLSGVTQQAGQQYQSGPCMMSIQTFPEQCVEPLPTTPSY